MFDIPDYGLFAIYLFYFALYVVSSFFIVFTMRASLKYQRRRSKEKMSSPEGGLKIPFLQKTQLFKKIRKDFRYKTELDIVCRGENKNEKYQGKLLDLSNSGCSAVIPELQDLKDLVVVEIAFPINGSTHVIPFPAEHMWVSENENNFHHGFRFRQLSDAQQSIFISFIVKYNKRFVQ